jgi:acetyltransferase-like isoleucine patch superfamily enzyme
MLKWFMDRAVPMLWNTLPFGILSYAIIKLSHPQLGCDFDTRLTLRDLGKNRFGPHINLRGVHAGAGLEMDGYTHIGAGSVISCSPEYPVRIGKRTQIAMGAYISTQDHVIEGPAIAYPPFPGFHGREAEEYNRIRKRMAVSIGNDVWVGCRACILRGVNIGDGAIIGAGAVVTKDVEPYMIVGGVPAKPIRPRFSRDVARQLQEMRWWDWPDDRVQRNARFFSTRLNDYRGRISDLVVD